MRFVENDQVTWASQSQDYTKTKVGHVVQVVPAGEGPDRSRFHTLYKESFGGARNHDSYVVAVNDGGRTRHYFPVASKLSLVKSIASEVREAIKEASDGNEVALDRIAVELEMARSLVHSMRGNELKAEDFKSSVSRYDRALAAVSAASSHAPRKARP